MLSTMSTNSSNNNNNGKQQREDEKKQQQKKSEKEAAALTIKQKLAADIETARNLVRFQIHALLLLLCFGRGIMLCCKCGC